MMPPGPACRRASLNHTVSLPPRSKGVLRLKPMTNPGLLLSESPAADTDACDQFVSPATICRRSPGCTRPRPHGHVRSSALAVQPASPGKKKLVSAVLHEPGPARRAHKPLFSVCHMMLSGLPVRYDESAPNVLYCALGRATSPTMPTCDGAATITEVLKCAGAMVP